MGSAPLPLVGFFYGPLVGIFYGALLALGHPNHDRQWIARQGYSRGRLKAGGAAPWSDLAIIETEPAMGVIGTQVFEIMGREIHHHQPPAGQQYTRRLGNDERRLIGVMEHLMNGHQITTVTVV